MSGTYKITVTTFLKRLQDSHYQDKNTAKRSLGRCNFSDDEKKKGRKAIENYYFRKGKKEGNGKSAEVKAKKTAGTKNIKKATTKSLEKGVPFEVEFARLVMNGQCEKTLSFLRGAADRGFTLPKLIHSIEAV